MKKITLAVVTFAFVLALAISTSAMLAAQEYPGSQPAPDKCVGRLIISAANVDVMLYACDPCDQTGAAQAVVDAANCAAIIPVCEGYYIADHRHQGFGGIRDVTHGSISVIETATGVYSYVCTETCKGYNAGSSCITEDGRDAAYMNKGGLMMYTCRRILNKKDITITFWQPVNAGQSVVDDLKDGEI